MTKEQMAQLLDSAKFNFMQDNPSLGELEYALRGIMRVGAALENMIEACKKHEG